MIELGVNIDHVATLRQARRTYEPDPVWARGRGAPRRRRRHHRAPARGSAPHPGRGRAAAARARAHQAQPRDGGDTPRWSASRAGCKPEMAMLVPEGRAGDHDRRRARRRGPGRQAQARRSTRLADAGIVTSACSSTPSSRRSRQRRAIGARVCEIHTGPYAHAFHAKGRDPRERRRSSPSSTEDPRRRARRSASSACASTPAMRSTTSTCSRSRRCPACASCTSATRSCRARVFVGLREAVREMKALMRQASRDDAAGVSGRAATDDQPLAAAQRGSRCMLGVEGSRSTRRRPRAARRIRSSAA